MDTAPKMATHRGGRTRWQSRLHVAPCPRVWRAVTRTGDMAATTPAAAAAAAPPAPTTSPTPATTTAAPTTTPPAPAATPLRERVAFLGAGNMASALIDGLIKTGTVAAGDMAVSSPSGPSPALAAAGVRTCRSNGECVAGATVVVVAVKPANVQPALEACRDALSPHALVVSLAAGVTAAAIGDALGAPPRRIVRVMPNTPCALGVGASGMARGPGATDADMALVARMLAAVGVVHEVKEAQLDAVTGLSGSGPAYVYMMIEALADGGVAAGLPRPVAHSLAVQTVLGSATLVATSGSHPAVLKDAVASPGGTTIAGIGALETGAFRGTVMSAVVAAARRATELRGPAK